VWECEPLYTISTAEGGKAAWFEDFIVQRTPGPGNRHAARVRDPQAAAKDPGITLLTT